MPAIDPWDDESDDDIPHENLTPTSALPLTWNGPLYDVGDDPRETLARILATFASAFGTQAGVQVDVVLTQLAVLLTQYSHRVFPLRAVITGPTGAGKTRLLRTIAAALRLPSLVVPATDLTETGWKGAQIGDACRMLHPELFRRRDGAHKVTVPNKLIALPSVVLVDEIDKIAFNHEGGRFDGSALASRVGKQASMLPLLDPLSEMFVHSDDATLPFRWSTRASVILCSGAFMQLPQDRVHTAADLHRVGFSAELIERMGPVLTLPSPSAETRALLARGAVADVEAFAAQLGVQVVGVDAFVTTLEPPGVSPHYLGVRGLTSFVRQRILRAIALAITEQRTVIDLRDVTEPT